MARLPHVSRLLDEIFEDGASLAHETDRLGEQGRGDGDLDRVLSLSRQEDRMLGWANLFASAFFGTRGEFSEQKR